MATGDDALAAGMDILTGSEQADDIDEEMNVTRDYIAQRTQQPGDALPISKGGTGASSAAAARTALGVPATIHGHLINQIYAMDGVTLYYIALQADLDAHWASIEARLDALEA